MAWTPTPEDQIPANDDLLANLAPEAGEGSSGYISASDLEEIVQGLMSQIYWAPGGTGSVTLEDASTTVKGVAKLASAPASASNPIAVGDNDPRLPTSTQKQALTGSSGTPGSGNRYVTETGLSSSVGAVASDLSAETAARAAADAGKQDTNQKGTPNGYAGLDGSGQVPASQLPPSGAAGESDASTSVKGITRLSVAPSSASIPIAAGDNDPRLAVASAGTASIRALGTTGVTAAAGNDARLSDTRTPTDGSVTAAKVSGALKPSASAAAADEALRAIGTTAGTAAAGNDSRLSDQRVPVDTSVTESKLASSIKAMLKGVCVHTGSAYPTRPSGFASVEWVGPTDPGGSAANGDTWVATA